MKRSMKQSRFGKAIVQRPEWTATTWTCTKCGEKTCDCVAPVLITVEARYPYTETGTKMEEVQ